jgi:hypothetical protein
MFAHNKKFILTLDNTDRVRNTSHGQQNRRSPSRKNRNMKPHTFKRSIVFPYQGYKVRLNVLAYRKIDNAFLKSCVSDWMRSQGRKKIKGNTEITFRTSYGA